MKGFPLWMIGPLVIVVCVLTNVFQGCGETGKEEPDWRLLCQLHCGESDGVMNSASIPSRCVCDVPLKETK